MENNQNTYQQQMPPKMGQPMMPPHPMRPVPSRGKWQLRAMNAIGRETKTGK